MTGGYLIFHGDHVGRYVESQSCPPLIQLCLLVDTNIILFVNYTSVVYLGCVHCNFKKTIISKKKQEIENIFK